MFGTLMLDSEGDLITATETNGAGVYETIGIAQSAEQVAQACSLRVSSKRRSVWFNRAVGIDYDALFYDANRSDATMNPIRAQAFRRALELTPGFGSYANDNTVTFSRGGRKLDIRLPCIVIDCENKIVTPTVIG